MNTSSQSEFGSIDRLLLKHAREAFGDQASIDRQWQRLGYTARPDLARAIDESERFAALLAELGVGTSFLPADPRTGLDSLYPRDAAVVCAAGLVLGRMGKVSREGEPAALADQAARLGLPVHGTIVAPGRLEGGDVAWIDGRTIVVGQGYRTTREGFRQLGELLGGSVEELLVVPLPHWRGPGDVMHLMSLISPVDADLAVVYSPLLPVRFREWLIARGIDLVEVPDAEFDSLGCNVLAVAPRRCLMLAGNPRTRRRLEEAGAEVFEYEGEEISRKGCGGPTCLTRPLWRA